jgi:hypothetical protein
MGGASKAPSIFLLLTSVALGCGGAKYYPQDVVKSGTLAVTVEKVRVERKFFIFDVTLENGGAADLTTPTDDITCARGDLAGAVKLLGIHSDAIAVKAKQRRRFRVRCDLPSKLKAGDFRVVFGAFSPAIPKVELTETESHLGGPKAESGALARRQDLSEAPPASFARAYYDRDNLKLWANGRLYQTVSDWVIGGSFGYGSAAFAASQSVPGTTHVDSTTGRSKLLAMNADVDTDRFTFNAYYNEWKGFAVGDPLAGRPVRFRSDIRAKAYGLELSFVKSPEDFAFPGRAVAAELPDGSGISLLAGVQAGGLELTAAEPLATRFKAPSHTQEPYYGEDVGMLDASIGLGLSLILGRIDLSAAVQASLGERWVHERDDGTTVLRQALGLPTRFGARYVGARSLEFGVFGIFADSYDGAAGVLSWQRELIETYLGLRF